LPEPDFRWSAPARRHRPCADPAPEAARLRRADLSARRFGAGADPRTLQRAEAGFRPHLPVHQPQPGCRGTYRGPDSRHVSWRDRGAGRNGRLLRRANTSLFEDAAVERAAADTRQAIAYSLARLRAEYPKRIPTMKSFIADLAASGELAVVKRPVNPRHPLAAITKAVQKAGEQAVLFEAVEGSALPVVSNLYGSHERLCRLIGAGEKTFCERWI